MGRAGWAAIWTLVVTEAALTTVHAGCSSVYDELYKPLAATGGGGAGASDPGGGAAGQSGGGTGGAAGAACGPDCCSVAEDCLDLGNACVERTCDDGACSAASLASGPAPAAAQTAGDCQVLLCDGAGSTDVEADDTDVPDDGQDCTVDGCQNGAPTTAPAAAGTACDEAGGSVCDALGACVECNVDADCKDPAKPDCVGSKCVEETCTNGVMDGDETDVDCGGACTGCDTGQACVVAADCYHGVCDLGACAAPTCDDGVKNGGEPLMNDGETDVDCGGPCGATCGPAQGCDTDTDCVGLECTGPGGTCIPNCFDAVANGAETDVDCGGPCEIGCAIGQACGGSDANCAAGAWCAGNVCAAKSTDGVACGGPNECQSGICHATDGVCCETACDGTCQSCKLAGQEGQCAGIPLAADPDDECPGANVCDGAGACKKSIGEACALAAECANGTCVDGVCCGSACAGPCQACDVAGSIGVCASIPSGQDPAGECPGATSCDGNGGCLFANGQACAAAAQCQSGVCADGVCCDMACGGQCKACDLAGSAGTCSAIPAGTDPDGECPGPKVCNSQGQCGFGP